MKGWNFRFKIYFGTFFFALSMPQEHLKQNKESDVYFTCTVVSCGKIPFNG